MFTKLGHKKDNKMERKALCQSIQCKPRGNDPAGSGEFGARRGGTKKHRGKDFKCVPHQKVLSPVGGIVTKLGYPYVGDMKWRYIEVTEVSGEDAGLRHRFFYVDPVVTFEAIGDVIEVGHCISLAQDITQRYPEQGMQPHIHVEIKDQAGLYLNPDSFGY